MSSEAQAPRERSAEHRPRVLFVTPNREDYLADSLLHGLRSVLGAAVVDFPKNEPLYASFPRERRRDLYGHGFSLYGLLEDLPLDRNRVLARAIDGEFDVVVFADIWRTFGLFTEFAPQLEHVRLVVLDGADRVEPYPYAGLWWRRPVWWTLPRAHRRATYFKREITPLTASFRAFLALPPPLARRLGFARQLREIAFSIPEEKIVAAPPEKEQLLATHVVDADVAALAGRRTSYSFDREQDYYADLRRSRFAVTTKRAGWEAMRHYEIAANGCVPCFRDLERKPPRCAPHGLDASNCVPYRDARALLAQLESMSDARYRSLQEGALRWARENTTRRRAEQFLRVLGLSPAVAG